jgi:hypothetical protein
MTTTNEQDTTTTTGELITDAQAAFARAAADLDDYLNEANTAPCAAPLEQAFLYPRLQWGKGVEVIGGRKGSQKYTGWLIEVDQELALDEVLNEGGVPLSTVQHMNGNKTVYWKLDSIMGTILCLGVPRKYGAGTWETGIPYVWNPYQDKNGKIYGSQLECLFFAQPLLAVGYHKPLRISLSRSVTEHFVKKALLAQLGLIDTLNDLLAKRGKPRIGLYSYYMTLIKGEEVSTGKGASYHPPVLDLPRPLNRAYLEAHKVPADHLEIIEAYLPKLKPWAKQTALDLAQPFSDWTVAEPTEPEPMEPEDMEPNA